ncbi:MAG: EAL domain-containing protein, partial [Chloroflexota bacterium]|nr:EAL domain-containing protein [Chloroflexota bacterium]
TSTILDLETFAQHAALAIDNARLLDALSLKVEHLSALLEISRDISSSLDPDRTFDSIVRTARGLLQGDISSLYLLTDPGDQIELKASVGAYTRQYERRALGTGEGVVGWVVETGEPVVVQDVDRDSRVIVSTARQEGIHSLVYVPIIADGQAVGAVGVLYRRVNAVPPHAVELLTPIASQAAIALRNSLLFHATKRHAEALRQSDERFQLVSRATNDAVWDCNLLTGELTWNQAVETVLGYSIDEVAPNVDWWDDKLHPDDRDRVRRDIQQVLRSGGRVWTSEHRFRRKDGTYAHFINRGYVIRNQQGKSVRMMGSMLDITERKQLESQLAHQAYHDPLTDLPNRTLFMSRLQRALQRSLESGKPIAVLFFDLDRFKVVNDSLGHEVGDQLLVAVAGRLRSALRPIDTVARMGGDEFTVLLEDVAGPADVAAVAERIAQALGSAFHVRGHQVWVSTSIGIRLSGAECTDPDALLRDADIAMYRAKSKGRARYEIYDPSIGGYVIQSLKLEADLWRAVSERELVVHFQPQLAVATRELVGFEGLVRWEHPERGLLPPADFMSIAAETGLSLPVGRLVLEAACTQGKEWQDLYPDRPPLVSVNLSAGQLQHPRLASEVAGLLALTGLNPGSLVMEIAESVLMQDPELSSAALSALKALGIGLAIDDFGTGRSSLGHLHRFPVDLLKLAPSFIEGLGSNAEHLSVVEAVIGLAHILDLKVVAEGVETEAQWDQLRTLGCDVAQGYYFAPPLPAHEAEKMLAGSIPSHSADEPGAA